MSAGSTVEEDIGDIKRREIFLAWDEGKDISRIADETGLKVDVVERNLRPILREYMRKRADGHG